MPIAVSPRPPEWREKLARDGKHKAPVVCGVTGSVANLALTIQDGVSFLG
jgi:hypothetical protein